MNSNLEFSASSDWIINGIGSPLGADDSIELQLNRERPIFKDVVERLFYWYIYFYVLLEKDGKPKQIEEKYYKSISNEYSYEDKIKFISIMLKVDLTEKEFIPFGAIYLELIQDISCPSAEWFLYGTINNEEFSFYDVLVKQLYRFKDELLNEVINNLDCAPKSFLNKLNEKLKSFKEDEDNFFQK